ncbi:MAG: hypothetical protein JJ866_15080 [Roseibium sp.]|uniref:hypothetical protein n=1 Tax=Roseibium sp. TaxID=1936156 RepID=UPI001B2CE7EB|nr:hypothetical protein [Roseibium sp.]MBO6893265.1 hypothetical protein [Roseibium sp.]MBO6932886.1 hypothetical protein [Roseibium sp.]
MPETKHFETNETAKNSPTAAALKAGSLSAPQKRWLRKGLKQPGGKLPLFDDNGREIPARTIRACIDAGWAEPWFSNPIKPDWLVCKLTPAAFEALSARAKGKKS